jgi:hypothetical protein
MHRVAKDAHELDPSKKSSLHESYHNNPNQVAGEKITAKLFSRLFEPFVEEKGISNPGTAADLMEVVMEKMWRDNHYLWQDLRDFMDMAHYVEIYRAVEPPQNNIFYQEF